MRKSLTLPLVAIALLGIALAGCSSKKAKTSGSGNDAVNSSLSSASTAGAGSGAATDATGEGIAGPQGGLLAQRIVYFDFDRSDIRADFVDMIAAHGRYTAGNANVSIRLEGHSDERGSLDYNIGLGERRAQAVRRALALQGVSEAQVATVSYGEERPAETGSTEEAWAKNRRVEIVYLSQ